MTPIKQIISAASLVKTAKGTMTMSTEALPKELTMLFGGLKTTGSDVVEVTHRVRTTGKSPFCLGDFKVKDKEGNLIDRMFASISDWTGNSYTVKWRKGSTVAKKAGGKTADLPSRDVPNKVDDTAKKLIDKKDNPVNINKPKTPEVTQQELPGGKPQRPKKPEVQQQELPFDKPDKIDSPIPGVLPPRDSIPAGLEPHPTQHIPNIRDFEIDGLLEPDMAKRLETIGKLQKDGRQAFFDPSTGKPNVFWSFDREQALEYFLKLLGR